MKITSYKDLNVWKKGIDIVDKIYDLTGTFPQKELYGLSSQMRRASVSIPTNIAEGYARHHTKEFIRFLYIALGSCSELETELIISTKRNFCAPSQSKELEEDIDHESRMLVKLIKGLRK